MIKPFYSESIIYFTFFYRDTLISFSRLIVGCLFLLVNVYLTTEIQRRGKLKMSSSITGDMHIRKNGPRGQGSIPQYSFFRDTRARKKRPPVKGRGPLLGIKNR